MSDIFFSPSTGGFYSSAVHTTLPSDAVGLTAAEHADLLAGQADGRIIAAGADGRPCLVEPAPPPVADLMAAIRAQRDARLAATDWTQLPDAPLTEGQRQAWRERRQYLRAVPEQFSAPASVDWGSDPA